MNDKYFYHSVIAHQYPEKVRIQDMLLALDEHYEIISKEEFHCAYKDAKDNKKAQ